jgi:3-phosphoshikimate 1-carboxyvinyltransferase
MPVRYSIEKVSGEITAPPSKSSMQRAVAAALLAKGRSIIHKPSFCDDSVAAMSMARSLGAVIKENQDFVEIEGGLSPSGRILNCGESGLGIRMFSAIAASSDRPVTIEGTGSLRTRPMAMIEGPLRELGAVVTTHGGFLPVEVRGPLKGGRVTVDGSQSSQFLTGLLFALPLAESDSIIEVINPSSKPYIELTLKVLTHFGIEVENYDFSLFRIRGGQQYRAAEYTVEGDWSGASFFLAMAAVGGDVVVRNLDVNSLQADRRVLDALKLAGCNIRIAGDTVLVEKRVLKPFTFNIADCPDLAPPLAVLAAACQGTSVITGTERLAIKESNRGSNLEMNLNELGAVVQFTGDRLEITGGKRLSNAMVKSSGDHRMAMAMAAISVITDGGVTIDNNECVSKSYPEFSDDFIRVGGSIST